MKHAVPRRDGSAGYAPGTPPGGWKIGYRKGDSCNLFSFLSMLTATVSVPLSDERNSLFVVPPSQVAQTLKAVLGRMALCFER